MGKQVKIAIVGAGNIGQAIAHVLREKENLTVVLWDKDETKVPGQSDLASTLVDSDAVFLCCTSWAARAALSDIAPHLPTGTPVISPIKGIEQKTLYTIDQIMADVLPDAQPIVLFNGPMLSAEMMDDLPSFASVATEDDEIYTLIETLFAHTTLKTERSYDVHGTALAGVLKNVYSIGLGMTAAMEMGSNFRGWFVRQASMEIGQIIVRLNGKPETAYMNAGLADLVATGFSPHSRNCKAGQELVTAGECITISEGEASLPQLVELLEHSIQEYPILSMIVDVIQKKESARERFAQLLRN